MEAKWRSYEVVDGQHPLGEDFRKGAQANGTATTRCPLCGSRRLHREHVAHYCDAHKSWICKDSLLVGCHGCRRRWGVTGKRCPLEAAVVAS